MVALLTDAETPNFLISRLGNQPGCIVSTDQNVSRSTGCVGAVSPGCADLLVIILAPEPRTYRHRLVEKRPNILQPIHKVHFHVSRTAAALASELGSGKIPVETPVDHASFATSAILTVSASRTAVMKSIQT